MTRTSQMNKNRASTRSISYLLRIILSAMLVMISSLLPAVPVLAQSPGPNLGVDYAPMLPVALTLLLPIGLILLISSAMPPDKAPLTAIQLLVVWSVTALAYFVTGFALQFGGIAQVLPNPDLAGLYWEWYPFDQSVEVEVARLWGLVALRGWVLSGEAATPGALRLFLSHVALVGAAAMIPAGALQQRERRGTAILAALFLGAFIYPVAGNWLWGGGWLSNLGGSMGLGHGLVDFGGASVVFLVGGTMALVALVMFRPETDRAENKVHEPDPATIEPATVLAATPMPEAYLPILSMLGAGLCLLGWLGLSLSVHNPTAVDVSPSQAAVVGVMAALSSVLTCAGYSWFTTTTFNPLMTSRGFMAGLIVITAAAPFVPIWQGVAAGMVMGLLLPPLIYYTGQHTRLADELGTVTTFGISAIASLFLVAFLANGQNGQGWNRIGPEIYLGVSGQGVSGLIVAPGFVVDWPGQLQAQVLGMVIIFVWTALFSVVLFQIIISISEAWARTELEAAPDFLATPVEAEATLPMVEQESTGSE